MGSMTIATKAARGSVLATTGGTRRPTTVRFRRPISTISTISTTTRMLMPMRTQRQRYRVTRTTLNATKTRPDWRKGFCLRGSAGAAQWRLARRRGTMGTMARRLRPSSQADVRSKTVTNWPNCKNFSRYGDTRREMLYVFTAGSGQENLCLLERLFAPC